jgi:hypothetical protein
MKKTIIVFVIILSILGAIAFIATGNFSRISSYIIGRITGGTVAVSDITLLRQGSELRVDFKDIRLRGNIQGIIRTCSFTINLRKGLYFKHISVSDFDILIPSLEKGDRFFTHPVELLEIKRGAVTVSGQKIIIGDIKAANINIGDTFTFEAHAQGGDFIGTMDIRGQGVYSKIVTDIKGDISFTSVNLAKIYKILKGSVNGKGTISFQKGKFVFEGKVEAAQFELNDTFLRRPLRLDKVPAEVVLSMAENVVDIKIDKALYKETPFLLNIRFNNFQFTSFELSSDFLDVRDVTSYATTEYSLQNLWDVLQGGQVKAKKLWIAHKDPISADLEVKNIAALYQDMSFNDIRGQVNIDESRVDISGLSGTYRTSRFYEVSGVVPYANNKLIRAKGKYALNLRDMPPFVDLRGITFREGTTDGSADVEMKWGSSMSVRGAGRLNDGEALWKNTVFSAQGPYTFTNNGATFNPLVVRKGSSDITCKGTWNKDNLDFVTKGLLDVTHLAPFIKIPFDVKGMINLDGEVHLSNGLLNVSGDLSMDDLAFEIPGFMKKEMGIKSKAQVKLSKKDSRISVDRLLYQLDNIKANATGTLDNGKSINADIKMEAGDMGRVAKLFIPEAMPSGGDASINLTIKNLELPLVKLPYMVGNAKINNGFLRLPGLPKPLTRMNLIADFKGNSFDVQMNGLACGQSVLKKGILKVNNLETPQFSLSLDLERFNLLDFKSDGNRVFKVPLIPQGSVLARANGDLTVKVKEITQGNIAATNLEFSGVMTDRKINISELKAGLFDGEVDIKGIIDLSGKVPYVYTNGRLARASSDLILQAFGSTTSDIVSKAFIRGDLKSEGDTMSDLIKNMDGNMAIYSRDGVIKKWKFLSKLFGALNVYDLLKGKVNFSQNGLGYSKLGAVFTVDKGVLHTTNFLLDSPSMVLTGKGDLDFNKNEINGTIQVAPIVALDRTIEKVPVIRNILKQKGHGFLYLTYTIKGSLDDPDFSSNVPSTIGGKALEILRNIIVLPKEVFE